MSAITKFDTKYTEVLDAVSGSHAAFVIAAGDCIDEYCLDDIPELERQVQLLTNALWMNPRNATSTVTRRILRPYLVGDRKRTPTATLLNHPGVIRSCLSYANFVDDEGITMTEEEWDSAYIFLSSIPGFSNVNDRDLPVLPRTAYALLGKKWDTIRTLYDVPSEITTAFRKAIHEVPDSTLYMDELTQGTSVDIPDSLVS